MATHTKVDFGIDIETAGGVGDYLATWATLDSVDAYDVSARVKGLYKAAWQAVQNFIDAAEEEGIFGEA